MPESIWHAGTPTLVVDTCSLLDLVRAPVRSSIPSRQILHAREIERTLSAESPSFRVLVCDWVIREYRRSLDGVAQDAQQQLKSMWSKHHQAVDVMAVHCGQLASSLDADAWIEEIINHGKDLAEKIIQASLQATATAADQRLATERTRDARAPSHKGKGSLADAVVTAKLHCALRAQQVRVLMANR